MIPISSDARFTCKDEKTGATYFFRYLVENDKQAEYSRITRAEKKRVDDEEAALPPLPDDATEAQRHARRVEAYSIVREKEETEESNYAAMAAYINIFLCGWEGAGVPEFPQDKDVSKCLPLFTKIRIYNLIQSNLSELIGLGADEIKN